MPACCVHSQVLCFYAKHVLKDTCIACASSLQNETSFHFAANLACELENSGQAIFGCNHRLVKGTL